MGKLPVGQPLRRLQIEAIDVYLSHWPDPRTPHAETLGAYQKLLDQGKIRSLPGITVYIVQPEDTLWDIAKRFYTTTEEISSMNELENEEISSGMPLLLVKKVEE